VRTTRVVLELVAGTDPLQGTIAGPEDVAPVSFVGWIELAGRVEALLDRGSHLPLEGVEELPGGG
jgi:hypothetical protein